jgi:hypothetical protein
MKLALGRSGGLMNKIGDSVFFEGIEYKILWIYSNGSCELVECSLTSAHSTILVHIDNLDKRKQNV